MSFTFKYLVRFIDEDGTVQYGNSEEPLSVDALMGQSIMVLSGDLFTGMKSTAQTKLVRRVLCPLPAVPVFHCVGVNYARHAAEAAFPVPTQPVVFMKPADSIAGPLDRIFCHPDSQPELDYEGELCFIFSRDCKDVPEDEALSYVLGYTIGNDLSARNFISQQVSGMQMSYGKSFDDFAPIGPYIVSPAVVEDPHNLRLTTKVNGQIRQDESTSDMIWSIRQIIVHLTRGRTVRAGTVCMTGTPSGVGWFMNPPGFIRHGDEVEISIEKLGTLKNKFIFLESVSTAAIDQFSLVAL